MNDLSVVHTWMDVSYVVQEDTKGHIGGDIVMDTEVLYTICSKQKLNTKIFKNSELVEASDYIV